MIQNFQSPDNKSRSLSGFQGIGMLPFHLFGLQPTRKNSSASDARSSAQFGTVQTGMPQNCCFRMYNDDLPVPNFGTRQSGAGLSWVLEVKWKIRGHRHLCFCFRKLLQMFSFCLVCSVWAKMKQPPLQMNQTSYQRMLLHPDDGW